MFNTPNVVSSRSRTRLSRALAVACLLVVSGTVLHADWPDNNPNVAKWFQYPDISTNGYDILAGTPPQGPAGGGQPLILADDFQCTQTGPITDIHIWASWLGLNSATNLPPIPITLGLWTDVPALTNANGGVTPSHPGQLLWSQAFGPGQYAVRPVASVHGGETFWDPAPAPAGIIFGSENLVWQYNFYPTNPFVQTVGTIYWLSVSAGPGNQTGTPEPMFGWKTTATNHWNDDAVFGHLDPASGQAIGDWSELIDPRTLGTPAPRSLDFSFILTTPDIVTNPPPPPPPPAKWIQYPNLNGGYDVEAMTPFVLADDFLCTNVSTITNIQMWSSFAHDEPATNLTFVLGIWSDALPTFAGGPSHPGTLLWRETFTPGGYTSAITGSGQESYFDLATGATTPESTVHLFSFTPVRPFCQQGSAKSPMVYWVSLYAKGPAGNTLQYGWKTTTNHFRDDAVFGTVDAAGTMGNWKELFAPATSPPRSLELAFRLSNGPPSPDCDPAIRPKWLEAPDTSSNGLDLLATAPEIVGDDFLCHTPGPISGITFWGSWLNDVVDPNATFVLRLWTDVPAIPGSANSYSHPGEPLCTTTFAPPQAVGTSLQRYQSSLAAANLQEHFFKPELGSAGFIGQDTQIWRYDFYPFQPSCWVQRGLPAGPGTTYWVTIDYVPSGTGGQFMFGAKTARVHLLDDAVYGHLDANNNPLNDWVDLVDPRSGQSLDLSHALWNFPVHGINKDLANNTTSTATGIQLVVAGHHVITWHYDGAPAWPVFQVSYAGGDTVLQWSGLSLPPGGTTHVGFEMAASANPQILAMNWMNGTTLLQPPVKQANFHWLNNGTVLVVVNNLSLAPLQITGGTIEWYPGLVGLDQMTANGQRTPMESMPLQFPPDPCEPGGAAFLPVPAAPPGAMYEIIIVALGGPAGGPGTTDYLLVPLDAALAPQIDSVMAVGPNVNLMWSAIPGRSYRILKTRDLASPRWLDSGMGDIPAWTAEMNLMLPLSESQAFYRIVLDPQ